MITGFTCFKNDKGENDKAPDYRLSAKIGEEWAEIGAGWVKEGASGKFISFQLKKPYQGKPGFQIVPELGEESAEKSKDDDLGL